MKPTQATILIADDDDDIRLALNLLLSSQGFRCIEAANIEQIGQQINRHAIDLVLLDMNFSHDTTSGSEGLSQLKLLVEQQLSVVLMTAWSSVELAVKGMQFGAKDFIEKPWEKHRLLQVVNQQCQIANLTAKNRQLQALEQDKKQPWIAKSASMKQLEQLVNQVAATDANILILGENGTGKSLLAQRIHQLSHRAEQAFVSVNMASIPETLFESELFGHKKGSFTDAKKDRIGRFELANEGSLFLDEIGTLPVNLQAKLLRVLESGEYEILGSSQTNIADVRVISATNANLPALVQQGDFRQDLLFRLNTFVIELPPLRERVEDIPYLANVFISQFAAKYKKTTPQLSEEAELTLKHYTWPGNIRELSHVIERAVLLCSQANIDSQHLMMQSPSTHPHVTDVPNLPLEQLEITAIKNAMRHCQGQINEAANALGISRNALYRRIEKYQLSEHDFAATKLQQ